MAEDHTPAARRASADGGESTLAQPFADSSYLAYVRPVPAPFLNFVSGHFPSGTSTQRHRHPCIALHGCIQGPLVLHTSRGSYDLDVGDFCLLAPEVEHHWANPSPQTGATFGLLIDAAHPGRWPAACGLGECCGRLERFVTAVHCFRTSTDEELQRCFWQSADHLTAIEPREPVAVAGALLSLVGACVQRLAGALDASEAANDVAVEIRRLLLARVNDRLTIADVARHLKVSATSAKEAFRQAFGTGIIAYHNQLKIWQAKRMLAAKSLTVDQVSRKLGFSSHSYFSRVFLQHTGKTPTEFRRHAGAWRSPAPGRRR